MLFRSCPISFLLYLNRKSNSESSEGGSENSADEHIAKTGNAIHKGMWGVWLVRLKKWEVIRSVLLTENASIFTSSHGCRACGMFASRIKEAKEVYHSTKDCPNRCFRRM